MLNEQIEEGLRASISVETTPEDVDVTINVLHQSFSEQTACEGSVSITMGGDRIENSYTESNISSSAANFNAIVGPKDEPKPHVYKSSSVKMTSAPLAQPLLIRANSAPITHEEMEEAVKHRAGKDDDPKPLDEEASWIERIPIPGFLKRLPSREEVPTFFCSICMENVAKNESFYLTSCDKMHEFCLSCWKTFVQVQINDGVVRLPCPQIGSCEGKASDEEVRMLTDDETFAKYERFQLLKSDPNSRECPYCKKIVVGSEQEPSIKCEYCSSEFCFFHSNAHPNSTCQEYARRMRNVERSNNRYIKANARPCCSCGAYTEKNGGCNHMTCQQCHQDWCWLCGREYKSGHYDLSNLTGCPGGQFQPAPSFALWAFCPGMRNFMVYVQMFLRIPQLIATFIMYVFISAVLLVPASCFLAVIAVLFPIEFLVTHSVRTFKSDFNTNLYSENSCSMSLGLGVGYLLLACFAGPVAFAVNVAWFFSIGVPYGLLWMPCSLWYYFRHNGTDPYFLEEDWRQGFNTRAITTCCWPVTVFIGMIEYIQGDDD